MKLLVPVIGEGHVDELLAEEICHFWTGTFNCQYNTLSSSLSPFIAQVLA